MPGYFAELGPKLNLGTVFNNAYTGVEAAVNDVEVGPFAPINTGPNSPHISEAVAIDAPLLVKRLARGPTITTVLYATAEKRGKPDQPIKVPLIGFQYSVLSVGDGEAFHMPAGVFGFKDAEEFDIAAYTIRCNSDRMVIFGLSRASSEPLRPNTLLDKLVYPDPDRVQAVYDGIDDNTQCSAIITIGESPHDALEFAGRTSVLKHFPKKKESR